MKKSKFFILLTLFAVGGLLILWTPSAGAWRFLISDCAGCGSRADAAVVDAAGDIIATGSFFYGSDVVKLSGATGELIWRSEVMGHESRNYVQDIAIDSHGDVFVVFAWTRVLIKVSGATGAKIWEKPIEGTLNGCQSLINAVVVDHDDDVVTAGTIGCLFNVAKLDGNTGDEKWHYEREGYARAVAVDPFGNVAAAGFMNRNFAAVKLRGEDGAELWQREINGAGTFTNNFEEANDVAMDKDGSVLVVGATSNIDSNTRDFTVAKYTPTGERQWLHAIDGGWCEINDRGDKVCQANDEAHAVSVDSVGNVIAAGTLQADGDPFIRGAIEHFRVFKFSKEGAILWSEAAQDPPRNEEYTPGHAFAVSEDKAGDVAASGVHAGRFTVVKFRGATGARAWPPHQVNSGGLGNGNNAVSVLTDADNNVVAAGEIVCSDGWSKFTVVKIRGTDGTDYFAEPSPTPTPTPSPTPVVTPVIFIPGTTGSRLNIPGTPIELWPGIPPTPHDSLGLDPARIPCPPIPTAFSCYRPDVDVDGVIRSTPPSFQVYGPLLDMFHREGYVEDATLFVFAYDWRKSNAVNAALLKNKIIEIRQRYPNSKVNIVTHSMGGLLARRYLVDNPDPNTHHVDKLITIAAPWLGAPKALLTFETGEFLPFPASLIIKRSTLKTLVDFYPSVHELMPSQTYFALGGFPFAEDDWDINGDGVTYQNYSYPQMYSLFNARHPRSLPSDAGSIFHNAAGQDDWRNRGFGVNYHHLYGWKPRSETILQVVAKKGIRCTPSGIGFDCDGPYIFDPALGPGDGTVPILSATRRTPSGSQDYNAENAALYRYVNGDLAEHVKLTQNPQVHQTIISILSSSPQSLSGKLSQDDNTNELSQTGDPVTEQAYYVRVEGAASATLTDEVGNVTHPLNDAPDAGIQDVTSYLLGEDSFLSIMPTDASYTLTFVMGESPVAINLTKGTDIETVRAIRYLDLSLPPGTSVRLEITPQGVGTLRYDSDGDGTFDTPITPTASVSGPGAQDTEPPVISFNEVGRPTTRLVDLNAADGGAGVRSLFYSLDGASFRPYVGTLSLNPRQTPVIYAFADDNVANRSGLATYSLTQPSESISGIVTDAGGNRMSGVTITVTGSQTASTTTDASGSYFFGSLQAGGNYTVVPSKTSHAFTPPSQTLNGLSGNQTANFAAIAGPILLTEENSTRAIALDSVTFARDPFSLFTRYNFSSDQRTRVLLFAVNVDLRPGETNSAITAQAEDSQQRIFPLTVEHVGKTPGFEWLTQITVRLPDGLAGDIWVSINLRDVASNKALISIKP